MNNEKKQPGATQVRPIFLNCMAAVLAAAAASVLLNALCAAASMLSQDPASLSSLGRAVFFVCALLCGFIARARVGHGTLICGSISGFSYCLLVYAVSLISGGQPRRWYLVLPALLCALVGAYAGCGTRSGARKPSHKKRKAKK